MSVHRARGITLIVAPIVQITDSLEAMRVYRVVVSSVVLYFAFVWCVARSDGRARLLPGP